MMVGLVLGIFVGVLPGLGARTGPRSCCPSPSPWIRPRPSSCSPASTGGALRARSLRSCSISRAKPGRWQRPSTAIPMAQQGKAAEALTAAFHFVLHRLAGRVLLITSSRRHRLLCAEVRAAEFFAVYLLTFCSFVAWGARRSTRPSFHDAGPVARGCRHGPRSPASCA